MEHGSETASDASELGSLVEKRLRESEERLRSIIDNTPDVIMSFDRQCRHLFVSPAVTPITGRLPEEFIGKTHANMGFPAEQCRFWEAQIISVFDTGKPVETEYEFIGVGERTIFFNWRLIPVMSTEGVDTVLSIARDITDRKIAEEKHQMLFLEMLDAYALHEIICDEHGVPVDYRFLSVNPAFEALTGLKAETIIGRTVLEVMPNTEKHWIDTYGQVALTGTPVHFENYAVELDRHYEVKAFRPARNQFACIFADVTERKKAEDKLRESAETIRALMNATTDVVFLTDRNAMMLAANETLARRFNQSVEKLVGTCFFDYIDGGVAELRREKFNEVLATGKHVRFEDERAETYFESILFPIFNERGDIEKIAVFARDITDRIKSEEALKKSALRHQMLMDAMPCVAVLLKPGTREIVATNKAGVEAGAVPGMTCHATWGGRKAPCPWCLAPELWSAGKDQHLIVEDSGIVFDAHWLHISDDLYMHYAFDITEQKRAEEELLKLRKIESVGLLAGGIAHDFNNHLAAILGNIEYAASFLNEDVEEAERSLKQAKSAVFESKNLTQQLLTFSKGGAPVIKSGSITSLLVDTVKFVLRGSKSTCEFNVPETLWDVRMDEAQISRVIQNIVINADQAMPNGGVIRVSAENMDLEHGAIPLLVAGKYVKATITDSGIGIPAEYQEQIFDPYFTTKQKGHGLGLATSYSIVRKHDGMLILENDTRAGATFSFFLPATEKTNGKERGMTEKNELTGVRILVMDDQPLILRTLKKQFERIGNCVATAENGNQALEIYRESMQAGTPFDVVMLDLTIPGGMGGKETLDELLLIDPGVKAIVASGYYADPIMANHETYGFKGIAEKPYYFDDICGVILKVLNKADA